jgi:hypothetical protein
MDCRVKPGGTIWFCVRSFGAPAKNLRVTAGHTAGNDEVVENER